MEQKSAAWPLVSQGEDVCGPRTPLVVKEVQVPSAKQRQE